MADTNRTAKTSLIVTAEGAEQGAAQFERAANRIKAANEGMVRATERADKALATVGKASDRAAKAQGALAAAEAKAAQVTAQTGASAEKVAKANERVAKASERVRKATDEVAAAQLRAGKAQGVAAEATAKLAHAEEMAALGNERFEAGIGDQVKQLERMRRQLDPTYDAMVKLGQGEAFLNKQLQAGRLGAEEHAKLLKQLKEAYEDTSDGAAGVAASTGIAGHQLKNLSYQFSDTVASLGSGAGVMQVLIQQGPQVADAFGGIPTLIGKIPVSARLAAAGLLAVGAAAAVIAARMSEIASQERRLDAVGKTLNPTFAGMAKQLREITEATKQAGASGKDAFAATTALAQMRDMTKGLAEVLGPLSVDIAAVLGTEVPDAAKKLGEGFTRGAAGVRELNKDLHFLGPEELKEIARLEKQGRTADLLALAVSKLSAVYKGKAVEMQSSWGQAMTAIGNAWDRMLERIGNDKGLTSAGSKVASFFDWFTDTFNPDLTKPVSDEIAKVTAELEAAKKVAEQLSKSAEAGVGTVGDPAGEAVQRVLELTDKLNRLKEAKAEAEKPPPETPAPTGTPALNKEGLTEDQAIEAERQRRIFREQTEALKGNAQQRQIAQAGLDAYTAAMERHGNQSLALIEKGLAEAAVRRDISVALRDENSALEQNIKSQMGVAEAYRVSTEAGLKAEAMAQALADAQSSGVNAADRANQLLRQNATEGFKAAAIDLARLKAEVANLPDILKGTQGGPAAAEAAHRKAEADALYRPRIEAAEAVPNNTAMVEQLKAERAETEALLKVRDDYNRQIATAAQFKQSFDDDLENLEAEARLIGATVEQREKELAVIKAKQALLAMGYVKDSAEYEAELKRLTEIILKREKVAETTRRQTEAHERNKQTALDSINIVQDGLDDWVHEGNQFIDVLRNMSKAFLKLGEDVLIMEPLKRWLTETMDANFYGKNGSSGTMTAPTSSGPGGGGWASTVSSVIQTGLNMWAGWNAGTGPSQMPNAASDPGALSGGALLENYKMFPVAHQGWHVGHEPPPQVRMAPTSVMVNAPRLHSGGMRPGEYGAILERGEEVLTSRNPRHRRNFQGSGHTVVMNITTPDANSFRQSQGQVTAAAARSLQMAARRNG